MVVMIHIRVNRSPQMLLADRDDPIKTLMLHRANKPLRIRIEIQLLAGSLIDLEPTEASISIIDFVNSGSRSWIRYL